MVRMSELPDTKRENIEAHGCPRYETEPWVRGSALAQRRISIVSTAGLIMRGERPLTPNDARYRVIPHAAPASEILMSHVSVNFDRTGYQQDLNCILPRDRLSELASDGIIGSVAENHYAFMGAAAPEKLEPNANRLAAELHAADVDTVLLAPV